MRTEDAKQPFFVAAYEAGAENTPVPTWASAIENPAGLETGLSDPVREHTIGEVPAACRLDGLLTPQECERLIALTEGLGYTHDASVSLPRSVRRNDNLVWVVDDATHAIIWERCSTLMREVGIRFNGSEPLGLNRRFRFYRYGEGDFFKPHTDGAWPGSRIVDGRLVADAYGDRYSRMTFLIFLSDGYTGGETEFYVDKDDPQKPAQRRESLRITPVRTPLGAALCFPHGTHPLHCLHGSAEIRSGVKYVIRTDLLFPR